jgi:hypothetical protein
MESAIAVSVCVGRMLGITMVQCTINVHTHRNKMKPTSKAPTSLVSQKDEKDTGAGIFDLPRDVLSRVFALKRRKTIVVYALQVLSARNVPGNTTCR